MGFNLDELKERYDIERDFLILETKLKKQKVNSILLQFPDGLKPYAIEITKKVKEITARLSKKKISVRIWLGSCFGACDIPNSKAELLVQFGHAPWN